MTEFKNPLKKIDPAEEAEKRRKERERQTEFLKGPMPLFKPDTPEFDNRYMDGWDDD